MLHELLLSLSGHPSPLLKASAVQDGGLQSLLSPAEQALLGSLAEDLGGKHKCVREHAGTISKTHPSPTCRAVASAILSIHLANFQQRILKVEKDILSGSANIVGAYNIVPLSALVESFDGWGRRLEWLWKVVQFVEAPVTSGAERAVNGHASCTAAMLIERLRGSIHTGYPDIGDMSLNLVTVAETAWLKQMSAWVLYGRHPGAADFFVTGREGTGNIAHPPEAYTITESLLPIFVTPHTATSIFFIGKSLRRIRERQSPNQEPPSRIAALETTLLPTHLAQLSTLQSPISSASLTAAIGAIRLSLSQNALQRLLPLSQVLNILRIFKDFFLLERGEFAVALITAADQRGNSGYQRGVRSRKAASTLEDNLASMTIKEGEVHSVLARTWTALASLSGHEEEEDVDEELERARELLRLSIKSVNTSGANKRDLNKEQAPAFDDLLLPSSTTLIMKVPSPLDLLLSPEDTETYSRIHAYLLAIRRAHLRLSKLFLLSKLRRDYPTPRAPAHLNPRARMEFVEGKRLLAARRTKAMRAIWATIGSATFFLAEVGEYFQGEVVERAWTIFHSWLVPPISGAPGLSENNMTFNSMRSSLRRGSTQLDSGPESSPITDNSTLPDFHDPESLTQAHKRYLDSLQRALLLDEVTFTRPLRRLMAVIDHLIALMHRLDALQTSFDIHTDAGSDHTTSHYPAEEESLMKDLRLSLPKIGNGVNELVEVLRTIDNAKISGKAAKIPDQSTSMSTEGAEFVSWTSKGLDRLLLKFDHGNAERMTSTR